MPAHVLMIDADSAQRDLICTVLKERLSCRTIGLATAQQAIQYLTSGEMPRPDLVMYDVPNVAEGCASIAQIRMLMTNLPIIVLIKYGDHVGARQALNAGAQDYLHKPMAVERISTTLDNMLALRDARRESEWLRHNRERVEGEKLPGQSADALSHHLSFLQDDGTMRRMDEIEAEALRFAMRYYGNHMTEVARRLGIGRSTLYRKLSELNIGQESMA